MISVKNEDFSNSFSIHRTSVLKFGYILGLDLRLLYKSINLSSCRLHNLRSIININLKMFYECVFHYLKMFYE